MFDEMIFFLLDENKTKLKTETFAAFMIFVVAKMDCDYILKWVGKVTSLKIQEY